MTHQNLYIIRTTLSFKLWYKYWYLNYQCIFYCKCLYKITPAYTYQLNYCIIVHKISEEHFMEGGSQDLWRAAAKLHMNNYTIMYKHSLNPSDYQIRHVVPLASTLYSIFVSSYSFSWKSFDVLLRNNVQH